MLALSQLTLNLAMWQLPAGLCGGVDMFLSVLFSLLSNEAKSKELFL